MLVAVAIITISILSAVLVARKAVLIANQTLHTTQATFLLEEGAEAVRSIRDNNWSSIAGLTPGTVYYLSFSSSSGWSLSTTSNTVGLFTRKVVLANVSRDASTGNISPTGTNTDSNNTKLVTITVSWVESGSTVTKTLQLYITNIFNAAGIVSPPTTPPSVGTFDAVAVPGMPTSYSLSHSSVAGSNNMLLVELDSEFPWGVPGDCGTGTAVSYNSVSMTRAAGPFSQSDDSFCHEYYYLLASSNSSSFDGQSHTLSVQVASTNHILFVSAINLSNVNQSNPIGTIPLPVTSYNNTISITPSTSPGQIVMDMVTTESSQALTVTGAGQSYIWNNGPADSKYAWGSYSTTSGTSTTLGWNGGVNVTFESALPINGVPQ